MSMNNTKGYQGVADFLADSGLSGPLAQAIRQQDIAIVPKEEGCSQVMGFPSLSQALAQPSLKKMAVEKTSSPRQRPRNG